MEQIKHECGVAMLRLLKPLSFYKEKYGSEFYGLNKMYILMEKEHNRGQEGAGIGCVRLEAEPGHEYIFRQRAEGQDAIQKIFANVAEDIERAAKEDPDGSVPFLGEVYMGHLRYSTTGRSGISNVHPFMRRNNWRARNMLLCGNFNMTNVPEILDSITSFGQHPRDLSDGFILLEQLGHGLDRENERVFNIHLANGLKGLELSKAISRDIDVTNVLHRCAPTWDGGYVICGIAGNGDMWTMRDPSGIRPAFYYADDEKVVVASERPVIQTAFDIRKEDVKELMPGSAIVVDRNGTWKIEQVLQPAEKLDCSFERIYFSRGNDSDIYRERKRLGACLATQVERAVDGDMARTVLSFVPNTAEVAYMGLAEELENRLAQKKYELAMRLANGEDIPEEKIRETMMCKIRKEKAAWKDIKMRTFIAQGDTRDDLAAHVYDITYDSLEAGKDNLVILDDSIVRGTTLRQSIIRILDRLHPKKIVIVSSSPQVRYPDCYGIDMSRLGEFIAFRAAMELLKERGMGGVIEGVYRKCLQSLHEDEGKLVNHVKEIYAPFTQEEISAKICEMLTPADCRAEVEIIFQSIENMHKAIPHHRGDWYFSGNYPTPGGTALCNRAFVNFYEGHADAR